MDPLEHSYRLHGKQISRRYFIASMGATGLLMGGYANSALAAVHNTLSFTDLGELSFVDITGLGPQIDAPIVEKHLPPLHKEQIQGQVNGIARFANETKLLRDFYKNESLPWQENFKLSVSAQHYGVAYENSDEAMELVEYSKKVCDYLFHRLRGLFQNSLNWNILHIDNYDLTAVEGFNIIIGRYTYLVSRIFVNDVDIDNAPYLASAEPLDRAINYIESGKSSDPKRGLIYLIPGATSLVSPFSEVLHLSLHKPSKMYEQTLNKEYSRKISHQKAIRTGETVNEALALMLATEFLEKYGRGFYKKHIDYMAESLAREYPKLPNVIAYSQRHGLQSTVDRYLDSPAKLMAVI